MVPFNWLLIRQQTSNKLGLITVRRGEQELEQVFRAN